MKVDRHQLPPDANKPQELVEECDASFVVETKYPMKRTWEGGFVSWLEGTVHHGGAEP